MNDIELSAREFVNQNKNCRETYPHTFFRMASAKLKILMSNLNSGDKSGNAEEEMVSAARAALRSLVIEKKHICSNGVPYSFLLFTSYIDKSGNAATTQSLSRFVNIVSVGHDFTVCELLTLRNFAVIACALKYADDGDIRCLSFFLSLENVDFEKIYIKYAKVHTIFSREKAAVYPNLCADTVRLYDERLLLMYDDEISGAKEIVARADTDGEHVGNILFPLYPTKEKRISG